MDEGYVWITTDAITARPDTLAFNDGSYLTYYRGILGTTPHYGQDTVRYNDKYDDYIENGGSSADFNMGTTKVSLGLELLHASLGELGTIDTKSLNEVKCGETNFWTAGQTLFTVMQENLMAMEMEIIDDAKYLSSYEIMNFKSNGFERIGYWTVETGLVDSTRLMEEQVGWNTRNDLIFMGNVGKPPSGIPNTLSGLHLRIGVVEEAPIAFFFDDPECEQDPTGAHCWTGWNPDIIERLSQDLNFTYEYKPMYGRNRYGGFDSETNSWVGLMGEIVRREVDLSTALAISTQRSQYIDFTYPFYEDSAAMAMYLAVGDAKPSSNKFFFLEPFEMSVWGSLIALIIVVASLTNFFSKFSPFGSYGEKMHAMQTCSCKKCVQRRKVKKVHKCRFVETKSFDCLVDKVEEDDDINDLSIYNSTWLIGTGSLC